MAFPNLVRTAAAPSRVRAPAPDRCGADPLPTATPVNDVRTPHVQVTVLIPTRNEEGNVATLLEQLADRLAEGPAPLAAEILLVDDSDDETVTEIVTAAGGLPVEVLLLHRAGPARTGGLGGAVLAGARQARGEWILVMDADLQHPPGTAVQLVRAALRQDCDVVIGTRHADGAAGNGLSGPGRVAASRLATRLAHAVFPLRLATVTDPMSGLFAVRRSAVDLSALRPDGFKILMEILVRHPAARVAEVSYEFAPRLAGRSKAGLREGLAFARTMVRLRRDLLGRQLSRQPSNRVARRRQALRGVGFGAVGASGLVVNTAALWFVYGVLGWHAMLGAALATQVSTIWNFVLVDSVVYRGAKRGRPIGRATRFLVMNNLMLLLRLPVLAQLLDLGIGVLAGNIATLAILFLARFLVSDRVIYGQAGTAGRDPVRVLVDTRLPSAATAARRRSQYLTYRYDIAGIVSIGSQVRLPELEFFRAQWISDDAMDLQIRVGDVGALRPRHRAQMTEYGHGHQRAAEGTASLRYEEHLGRVGANFRVMFGEQIRIEVGPLLARSPHVVYTNIVEALLRFVMVDRGHMLLHSACVELDGHGVMLSALTDTGKTATVLRLLREHGGRFLSDDMTIVAADGTALCFPKPLTISAHTLRAVHADDLTGGEWRRLQLQSRLHSRGGRSIAFTLSRFNLPIMGINAITQWLIPPPKYSVDRLVPCRMGSTTRVEDLFVIERGTPRLADLDLAETHRQLLCNTDDAYGFPPFRHLAPSIVIGGRGYPELRRRESEILTGFLGRIRTRVLASDSFGWADEIPALLRAERPAAPAVPASAAIPVGDVPVGPAAARAEAWPRWGRPVEISEPAA
jgi:glycosyltransferase involved in cell wall biosynthesis